MPSLTKLTISDQLELFKQLKDNSIDAIVTDPPYGVLGKHKIETQWCIETFIKNCHRVLKDKGFLVYFCQEPFASKINNIAYQYFSYKEEIIWNKISHNFRPSAKINRSHEKLIILGKDSKQGSALLRTIKQDAQEKIPNQNENTAKRQLSCLLKFLKQNNWKSYKDIENHINNLQYTKPRTKTNDTIHNRSKCNKLNSDDSILKSLTLGFNYNTIWQCMPHNKQKYGNNQVDYNIKHPTVKPIQMTQRAIEFVSDKQNIILDPFMGSGTTALACINSNRKFIGFELDEGYCNIAKDRVQKHLNTQNANNKQEKNKKH